MIIDIFELRAVMFLIILYSLPEGSFLPSLALYEHFLLSSCISSWSTAITLKMFLMVSLEFKVFSFN